MQYSSIYDRTLLGRS